MKIDLPELSSEEISLIERVLNTSPDQNESLGPARRMKLSEEHKQRIVGLRAERLKTRDELQPLEVELNQQNQRMTQIRSRIRERGRDGSPRELLQAKYDDCLEKSKSLLKGAGPLRNKERQLSRCIMQEMKIPLKELKNEYAPLGQIRAIRKKIKNYIDRSEYIVRGVRETSRDWGKGVAREQKREPLERQLRAEWKTIREPLLQVIVEERDRPGFYCHLPRIALPQKKHQVVIFGPVDLVQWLVARAVANWQHLRFVKCQWCNWFKYRIRATIDMHYCSKECQEEANHHQKLQRYAATLPDDRAKELRFKQLSLLAAERGNLPRSLARELTDLRHELGHQ